MYFFLVVICLGLIGCSTYSLEASTPRPVVSGYHFHGKSTRNFAVGKREKISVDKAQALGLAYHPRLRLAREEIAAHYGNIDQAGLWANPRLETQVENIDSDANFDNAKVTVAFSQKFPVNGAMRWAILAADKQGEIARWEYAQEKTELFFDIYLAFYTVLIGNERQKQLRFLYRNAAVFQEKIKTAVDAGTRLRADLIKAELALNSALLNLQKAQSDFLSAQKKLASLLGIEGQCTGNIFPDMEIPAFDDLQQRLERHPRVMQNKMQQAQLEFNRRKLNAERWPNPEFEVGARHNYAEDESSFLLGVEIELPLWNRNQGKLRNVQAIKRKNMEQQKNLLRELKYNLFVNYQNYHTAKLQARQYVSQILPAAQQAVGLTQKGYQQGKLSILEVIDAQKTQVKAYLNYLDALERLHGAFAALCKLTGPLPAKNT